LRLICCISRPLPNRRSITLAGGNVGEKDAETWVRPEKFTGTVYGQTIGDYSRGARKPTLPRNSFNQGAVFDLLYPAKRSTVGAWPPMGQLATDEGRKFFAYAGKRVTARVDEIMEKAWARLCTS